MSLHAALQVPFFLNDRPLSRRRRRRRRSSDDPFRTDSRPSIRRDITAVFFFLLRLFPIQQQEHGLLLYDINPSGRIDGASKRYGVTWIFDWLVGAAVALTAGAKQEDCTRNDGFSFQQRSPWED